MPTKKKVKDKNAKHPRHFPSPSGALSEEDNSVAEQGSLGDEASMNDALTPDGRVESREDQPDPRLDQSTDIHQNDSPLDKTEKTPDGSSVNTGRPVVERSALLKQSCHTGHSVTTGHSVNTERSVQLLNDLLS